MIRRTDLRRAEEAAYRLLAEDFCLPASPLEFLRRRKDVVIQTYADAAESLGMTEEQFERKFGRADAFTLCQDTAAGKRYIVSYRSGGNPARLRFTLAHELGHIILAHAASGAAEEKEADHFASCFLCPSPVLKTEPEPAELARRCYVSLAAANNSLHREKTNVAEALLKQITALCEDEQKRE